MLARILSILLSLSVFLPSAAMADWNRSDGFGKKPKKASGYDDDYEKDSKKKRSSEEDAASSDAQEASESEGEDGAAGSGFAVGTRLGFGLPFGKLGSGEDAGEASPALSDLVSGGFPAQLDVGYFMDSRLYVGGFFQYGLMMFGQECPDIADCSASQLRFGLNAAYSFTPEGKLSPWMGLGIGYEMLNSNVSSTIEGITFKVGQSLRGFEFANLQGGVDFRIGKSLWVGPYANFTVGQYSNLSLDLGELGGIGGEPGEEEALSGEIPNKAFHFWLMGGVRVLFRL